MGLIIMVSQMNENPEKMRMVSTLSTG